MLGEGSFGTTYRGAWRGADCAVKVVRISKPDEANSFLREVEALSLLRHPHIMPFFGAHTPSGDRHHLAADGPHAAVVGL